MKVIIVNNTGENISLIHSAIVEYANTGIINDELADIFKLERIETESEIRVIVNLLEVQS